MEVKILEVSANQLRDALIRKGELGELPSMHDEWRFNFSKNLQKLTNATAYVLVAADTPTIIEGCLIFQMKDKVMPYMAFVEIAPHNRGDSKKYNRVAGCLIAFAFKQSYIKAKKDYKGILFFDVQEETEEETEKLMRHYSKKYNAKLYDGTRMIIVNEDGDELVKRYLPEN